MKLQNLYYILDITSFNSHNNPMRKKEAEAHFTDEQVKA